MQISDIENLTKEAIAGSDKFIVEINIGKDNTIEVYIDSDKNGVGIDDCAEISRKIESSLNRDEEDFELQVSSAGLDMPLKLPRQYKKNIGKKINIVFKNGKKLTAKLVGATDTNIDTEYEEKIAVEGKKRKQLVLQHKTFAFDEIKTVKIDIDFK